MGLHYGSGTSLGRSIVTNVKVYYNTLLLLATKVVKSYGVH